MTASVIDPETFDDEWFGGLSDREMIVWIGVFSRLRDDQGRFIENAALARARLWPYRDVPIADVQAAFDRFVDDGRLHRYAAGGHTLLQIVTWWEHQRPQWAAASKLPSPEGWTDRVRTRQNGKYVDVNWSSPGGFARTVQANGSGEGVQANASGGPFGLAREPEPEPEPEPVISTPDAYVGLEPQSGSRKSSQQDLPEIPDAVRKPVAKIVGAKAAADLAVPGTDLRLAVSRYVALIDDLADKALAEQSGDDRTAAKDRCRRIAFQRLAATNATKPIGNLPAYLTAAAARATGLGDLVGDALVRELRTESRPKRNGKGEPRRIADVLPDTGQACEPAGKFPAEVAS